MRCLHPLNVSPYKNIKRYILVPCGKCPNCIKTKRDNLAFRLDAEHNSSDNLFSLFVTLTYSDEHLPTTVNDITGEVFNYLSSDDIHNFFKYLRKLSKPLNFRFKYFLSGEYGDSFGRPHYHAILFVKNIDSTDPVETISDLINKAWYRGFTSTQLPRCGFRAFNYVTKYVIKSSAFDLNEHYKDNKPFIRMSNGIGLSNVMRFKFKAGTKLEITDSQNRVHILPRYYLTHIFNDVELWKHQFYTKSLVTDDFINRCKRYLLSDSEMQQYEWTMRGYESLSNIRKSNSIVLDQFYTRNYERL